ncbi:MULTISPECIES: hypothetical protein [unclassified Anabaena]|uniref:hypothetical protein n=1 Tax=unclassified Anabaena TaxID=2619674 RepID=UPI0014476607|nr:MULTISPECIES: hypothetical protein [unclassified Anabaena]
MYKIISSLSSRKMAIARIVDRAGDRSHPENPNSDKKLPFPYFWYGNEKIN